MNSFFQAILTVIILGVTTASGALKYVATAPAGTNNPAGGAIGSPWKDITFALTNVVAGDIINVASGTYNVISGETFPLFLPDQVSLIGTDRKTTILDAGDTERVITATNCVTSGLIANLTIQKGRSIIGDWGGGIFGTNGLTVSNCIVRANSVSGTNSAGLFAEGGGIAGAGLVTKCTIESNYAYHCGGLRNIGIISDCIIRENTSSCSAGGVRNANIVQDSLIEKNQTIYNGGGLCDIGVISGCVIKYNTTSTGTPGGGVYNATAISNSVFIGNDSVSGAGLYDADGADVFNCLFVGNFARGAGGAIYMLGGKIRNCTIVGNVGYTGGGLSINTSTIVSNCIVWNNSDDLLGHNNANVTYSIISDGDGDSTCTNSNPLFIGGYFLDSDSPAINTGAGNVVDLGLTDKVNRADGAEDDGIVDIGYHYPAGSTGSAADRYVRSDGNNGNNGASNTPSGAWRTITYALSQAQPGWTVHVGTGTYNTASGEIFTNYISGIGGILVPDAITLIGDAGPLSTIIDTTGSGKRVLFAPGTATIAGLTLRNARITAGGTVYFPSGGGIRGHGVVVSNCIVQGNYVNDTGTEGAGLGGGIYGCRLISGNEIVNNHGSCGAGGIADCVRVTGNLILANRGDCAGAGGIRSVGGIFENNVIAGNFAYGNYGTDAYNPSNAPYGDGGITCGGVTILKNNTIAYNRGSQVGGVQANGTSTSMRNNILWGNEHVGAYNEFSGGSAVSTNDIIGGNNTVITYSDIEDPTWGGTGSIHTNPLFNAPMGSSTALTDTQLRDSSANWEPDTLIGAYLNPNTTNNIMPLVFRITANDKTTLTCAGGGLTATAVAGQNYRVEDYHIKSPGGRYTYGLGYVYTDEMAEWSPCVDAGDTNDVYTLENADPERRGTAINMGAFGNTTQASLSDVPTPPGSVLIIL